MRVQIIHICRNSSTVWNRLHSFESTLESLCLPELKYQFGLGSTPRPCWQDARVSETAFGNEGTQKLLILMERHVSSGRTLKLCTPSTDRLSAITFIQVNEAFFTSWQLTRRTAKTPSTTPASSCHYLYTCVSYLWIMSSFMRWFSYYWVIYVYYASGWFYCTLNTISCMLLGFIWGASSTAEPVFSAKYNCTTICCNKWCNRLVFTTEPLLIIKIFHAPLSGMWSKCLIRVSSG